MQTPTMRHVKFRPVQRSEVSRVGGCSGEEGLTCFHPRSKPSIWLSLELDTLGSKTCQGSITVKVTQLACTGGVERCRQGIPADGPLAAETQKVGARLDASVYRAI